MSNIKKKLVSNRWHLVVNPIVFVYPKTGLPIDEYVHELLRLLPRGLRVLNLYLGRNFLKIRMTFFGGSKSRAFAYIRNIRCDVTSDQGLSRGCAGCHGKSIDFCSVIEQHPEYSSAEAFFEPKGQQYP